MDVLSEFLDASGLRGRIFCQTRATAPWGLWMPPLPQVGLHVASRGTCWVRLGEDGEPRRILPGDAIFLSHGTGHALMDDPSSPLQSFDEWKARRDERHRLVREAGGGGETTHLICAAYRFESGSPHPLVRLLPALIHIRADATTGGLARALRSLKEEFENPDVGSPTMVSRLLDVVFVEALRAWLSEQEEGAAGWLGGLRDAAIADTLARLHRQPERPWTVAGLGREVGMSRPVLARRFRQKVGMPPLAYLTQVRMDLAARLLLRTDATLAEIAGRVGYDSEFAFNRAFKKAYGVPPGRFRKAGGESVPASA